MQGLEELNGCWQCDRLRQVIGYGQTRECYVCGTMLSLSEATEMPLTETDIAMMKEAGISDGNFTTPILAATLAIKTDARMAAFLRLRRAFASAFFGMKPQPCKGCLFWYGVGAFGKDHCEIKAVKPWGPCPSALVPLARELKGLPPVRVVSVPEYEVVPLG